MILLGLVGFKLAGKFLKHALGLMILCWRRMLRAAAIAALIGVVGVEVLACLSTDQFPPPVLAQPVAAALALALAYSAALTVLIVELISGTLDTIRLLMGEAEAGARAATAVAKHEATDARSIVDRLLGVRGKPSTRPQPPRREVGVAVATSAAAVAAPVMSALRGRKPTAAQPEPALESAPMARRSIPSTPRPIAMPVPASQLPRIAWTYEEPVHAPPPRSPEPQPPTVALEPPQPVVAQTVPPPTPPAAPTLPIPTTAPAVETLAEIAPTIPPIPTPRVTPQEERREPQPTLSEEDDTQRLWVASSVAMAQAFREPDDMLPALERFQPRPTRPLGRATHPLNSTTRPLGRVTRPLAETNRLREARDSGGLWDRLSQALIGSHGEPGDQQESELASTPPDVALSEQDHDA